jgi:hypothetical protein
MFPETAYNLVAGGKYHPGITENRVFHTDFA